MAGHRHFAGIDPASDMLDGARASLQVAAGADREAVDRRFDAHFDTAGGRRYKDLRQLEERSLRRGSLEAQIALAEMLQRLVGRAGEVSPLALCLDERIRRTAGKPGDAAVSTDRTEAFERVQRLITAAEESGEELRVAFLYPLRRGDDLDRPKTITVQIPDVLDSEVSDAAFRRDTRLEKEEHPGTARARRSEG